MPMKSMESMIHKASQVFSSLSVIVLFLMMMVITIDVVGRYLLRSPIAGSVDVITLMMVILIFPSLGHLTSLGGNVRTDLLYARLPKRKQAILDLIGSLCSLFIVAMITWRLIARAWSIVQNPPGIVTTYFQWSHLPFICLAAIGCGLMCMELIIWFCHSIGRAKGK
jgi:TRAP-type C4-dicarboxylate transport system permease small subunit